jgi:hypothetical protein
MAPMSGTEPRSLLTSFLQLTEYSKKERKLELIDPSIEVFLAMK